VSPFLKSCAVVQRRIAARFVGVVSSLVVSWMNSRIGVVLLYSVRIVNRNVLL
jgi:hypothetical protein